VKFPVLLALSLASAVSGSLFLSGLPTFFVQDSKDHHASVPQAEAAALPLQVIERFTEKRMAGDAEMASSIKIDDEFVDPENHCEFCTRVEYVPGSRGVAGFAYSSDKALDLTGAKKIRFWIMGDEGGEKVKFKIAGKEKRAGEKSRGATIFDSEIFARTSKELALKDDWTKYEVDLQGVDLRAITKPLGLELAKGADEKVQVVYIKGIVIDDQSLESENELATVAESGSDNGENDMSVAIRSNGSVGDTGTAFRFRADVMGGERPYTYLWEFGDGTEKRNRNVLHSFSASGTYNVTLVVADQSDYRVTESLEIEIVEKADVEAQRPEDSNGNDTNVSRKNSD
jgi:hypothetical protein